MRITRHFNTGYSLIEQLMIVFIVGVLSAVTIPPISRMMRVQQVRSLSTAFVLSLHLMRSEAIKRNARVALCKSRDGDTCTNMGGWDQGWIMFHDPNNNAVRDAGETVIQNHGPAADGLHMTGNSQVVNYVSYGATGNAKLISGAFQAGTFTICPPRGSDVDVRLVILSPTGRPRTTTGTAAACP